MPIAATSAGRTPAAGQGFLDDVGRDLPDLLGVVLDPSRPGEVLGEFAVAPTRDLGLFVQDQDSGAGRALVDGDDRPHAGLTAWCR